MVSRWHSKNAGSTRTAARCSEFSRDGMSYSTLAMQSHTVSHQSRKELFLSESERLCYLN